MQTKVRKIRKNLKNFCVEGKMERPQTWVKEFAHAMNETQALKVIALRLEKRHGSNVYIGNCSVREVPENPGKKK